MHKFKAINEMLGPANLSKDVFADSAYCVAKQIEVLR